MDASPFQEISISKTANYLALDPARIFFDERACSSGAFSSPRDHVSELGNERAVHQGVSHRVPPLVVNNKKVAQRTVDEMEPDIGTPLLRVAVVLD